MSSAEHTQEPPGATIGQIPDTDTASGAPKRSCGKSRDQTAATEERNGGRK
jgi:hypothetical protein